MSENQTYWCPNCNSEICIHTSNYAKTLQAQLEKCKEALRFYGDVNNYDGVGAPIEQVSNFDEPEWVQDHGECARQTLKDIEGTDD